MKPRCVLLMVALAMLTSCDSTPGVNPFAECLVVIVPQPPEIRMVEGDSVPFVARRLGFCDQQRTRVEFRLEDTVVVAVRPVTDSSLVIKAISTGVTALIVIDRADTLQRAGVPIIVTPVAAALRPARDRR